MSGSIGVATQAPEGSQPSDESLCEAATVTQVLTVNPHALRPGHWDQGTYVAAHTHLCDMKLIAPQAFSPTRLARGSVEKSSSLSF